MSSIGVWKKWDWTIYVLNCTVIKPTRRRCWNSLEWLPISERRLRVMAGLIPFDHSRKKEINLRVFFKGNKAKKAIENVFDDFGYKYD